MADKKKSEYSESPARESNMGELRWWRKNR